MLTFSMQTIILELFQLFWFNEHFGATGKTKEIGGEEIWQNYEQKSHLGPLQKVGHGELSFSC